MAETTRKSKPAKARNGTGKAITLAKVDPRDTDGTTRESVAAELASDLALIDAMQEECYVAQANGVLVVLQGLDACGSDGVVRHVFNGVNPAGARAVSFKVPTEEERAHDYLWRIHAQTPRLGEWVVFNRSHYEAVLAERVLEIVPPAVWKQRYQQINEFEAMLAASGTVIMKFLLHISKDEQEERLLDRMRQPDKQWKVNQGDWDTRAQWDDYQAAFHDMLTRTSTAQAPWHVIPADRKWYRNYLVARIIADTLGPYRRKWRQATLARGRTQMGDLTPDLIARIGVRP